MVGFRSEDFYILKYGQDKGSLLYKKVVDARNKRERRKSKKTSIFLSDDPEEEIKKGNAIRCMGCGYVSTRLQWSHFKFKCKIKSLDEYKKMYPESPLVAPNLIDNTKITLENMIKVYGEIEGHQKWDEYRKKQAISNTFEYKKEKFGWDNNKFVQYNKNRSVTFENLISRHGIENGTLKWKEYCERQRYTNTKEYFIEREQNSDIGEKIYLDINFQKGKPRRVEYLCEKYKISIQEAEHMLSNLIKNSNYVSKAEQIFVDNFETIVGIIPYTYKTKQFSIWSKESNRIFFYDVCCPVRKKIIEFNGDYWHARPEKYEKNHFFSQRNLTAMEIWELDDIKHKTCMDRNFEIVTVWESDYIKNGITKEVIDWWSN